MTAAFDQQSDGTLVVQGALQIDTVTSLFKSIDFSQLRDQNIRINLTGVDSVDSAGLALCLHWVSIAKKKAVCIEFQGVPDQLRRLASMNQLEDLFIKSGSAC